ncbi:GNAT family N-acetyltransferase [Clostridium estertheticum]|uniref:GNAT family N-acetyltransferase n=2 Tax=Clostridium estertheticum TaxID=238834 RepID=UPI00124BDAA6|nr:GNAT family N-acetyltransferase [Clostridium estertheticum]WAG76421.1 GNAT family N-acetyltransferase [Clostridium estertheticum]
MINKKIMMDCVNNQLAIDYNCSPDDFLKDGLIFTKAREKEGRRPFPWVTPRLEMVTMGHGVVINASEDILPSIRKYLEGKTRFEAFRMPFVYGINPYFLPDIDNITPLNKPKGFEYEMVEKQDIHKFYEINDFHYAIQYDMNSPRPEMLVILAKYKDKVVGMAGASADCKTMWQIGVDVLQQYRGKGLATALVNMLTLEILKRGYIPYYSTDCSNVISQNVAVKAGYFPAWAHCYSTRLNGLLL